MLFTAILTSCSNNLTIEDISQEAEELAYESLVPSSIIEGYEIADIVREDSMLHITMKNIQDNDIVIEFVQREQSDFLFDKLKQIKIGEISKDEINTFIETEHFTGILEVDEQRDYYSLSFERDIHTP